MNGILRQLGSLRRRLACGTGRSLAVLSLAIAGLAGPGSGAASAQLLMDKPPDALTGVEIEDRAGGQLPLDAVFTDHTGTRVPLRQYFDGSKPSVIVMVYYDCPVVCPTVLSFVLESVNDLDFDTGRDFNLLVFSIDPSEQVSQAADARANLIRLYDRSSDPEVAAGWSYHVGDPIAIRRMSDAMGWSFKPLDNGEYSHPVGIVVASPDGVVSRYFYGYDYPAKQLKLALLDATEGKIAKSLGDKIMHYCFRWDPTAGVYSVEAMAVMRIAGALTVVLLTGFIVSLLIGERIRRRRMAATGSGTPAASARSVPAVPGVIRTAGN